jgi:hypothetical protein
MFMGGGVRELSGRKERIDSCSSLLCEILNKSPSAVRPYSSLEFGGDQLIMPKV